MTYLGAIALEQLYPIRAPYFTVLQWLDFISYVSEMTPMLSCVTSGNMSMVYRYTVLSVDNRKINLDGRTVPPYTKAVNTLTGENLVYPSHCLQLQLHWILIRI